MKKHLTLLFSGLLLMCSCQKNHLQEDFGWNALAFTESSAINYLDYMNEPHVNISFPLKTETKDIIYKRGTWVDNNKTYVLTAHNWTDQEIVVHIYKDKTLFNEFTLKPESATGKESNVSLKEFSLSFQPTPGEYSFKVSVKDIRGITILNQKFLHGSVNKMVVL